jgi:hypothetical protein
MTNSKVLVFGLLATLSAAAVAACGSSQPDSSTTPEGTTAAATTPEETPSPGALPEKSKGSSTLYDAWAKPDYEGDKISKVMVMGVGDDPAVVNEFETAFTDMLTKSGIEAVKASNVVSPEDRQNKDAIVKKLEEAQYTGAVVTRLVSVDSSFETKAPNAQLNGTPFIAYYQSALDNPAVMKQEVETTTVTLETALYKIPEAQIVWCGTTESFNPNPERRQKILKEIGTLVIDSLKGSGLLAGQ